MKDQSKVQSIYGESRNGANSFFRHPLARNLVYTDGVRDVAEAAGAYWLLDIIGTEVTPILLKSFTDGIESFSIIKVTVKNEKAIIEMTYSDYAPPAWSRKIEYTDFPSGTWTFYLAVDESEKPGCFHTTLILPSEH